MTRENKNKCNFLIFYIKNNFFKRRITNFIIIILWFFFIYFLESAIDSFWVFSVICGNDIRLVFEIDIWKDSSIVIILQSSKLILN